MPSVVATMSISLDGVGAGVNQTEERPFGAMTEQHSGRSTSLVTHVRYRVVHPAAP